MNPTFEQLSEFHEQVKAGRITRVNFQAFIRNPSLVFHGGFPVSYDQGLGLVPLIERGVGTANLGNINRDITQERYKLAGTGVRQVKAKVEPYTSTARRPSRPTSASMAPSPASATPATWPASSTTTRTRWRSGAGSTPSARTPAGRTRAAACACRVLAWVARSGTSASASSAASAARAAASSSSASRLEPRSLGNLALRRQLSGPRFTWTLVRRSPSQVDVRTGVCSILQRFDI